MHLAGPPLEYAYGTMVGTWTPVNEAELERIRDSLAMAPISIAYEVDEDDFATFGSLAEIQRAVDSARAIAATAVTDLETPPLRSIALITALYAKHDAASADWLDQDLLSA